MKRFKVTEDDNEVASFNSLKEAVNWLKQQDLESHSYYVGCAIDDVEVHSDDILDAFENGESPEDLQFF
jgi:hypothetical protein